MILKKTNKKNEQNNNLDCPISLKCSKYKHVTNHCKGLQVSQILDLTL